MLNSYHIHSHATEYIPFEKTVKEIKAPTDESIKLYEEIKQKAYESILDSIIINNNTFNCKAEIVKDWQSYSNICYYEFTLNNKKIKGKIIVDSLLEKEDWIKKIYEEASNQMAYELLNVITKK